jgi:hypothetical protein
MASQNGEVVGGYREDGFPEAVKFEGKVYDTPSFEELVNWSLYAGGSETPDGRWVEPDHPAAWTRLIGLI